MSKILVEFDTAEKSMTASIDGKALENVCGASFYTSWREDDEYSCELCTLAKNEEDGYMTHTRVVASETDVGKELEDFLVHEDLPGFKIVADKQKTDTVSDDLKKSVASYFGANVE